MKALKHLSKKGNRQFLLTFIISIISVIIGLIQILKVQISPVFLGISLVVSVLTAVSIFLIFDHFYKRRYTIFSGIGELYQAEAIDNISVSDFNDPDRACLNRFQEDEELYWPSSWIGAASGDVVENVIIKDDRKNGDLQGKVPIVSVSGAGNAKYALKLRFNHKENGWWTAVIHGTSGKPSNKMWSKNTLDLSVDGHLQFTAKSNKEKLDLYIRFEDIRKTSSNAVIISVNQDWNEYRIPISKFEINKDLSYDSNYYLEHLINTDGADFDIAQVMQIDFGYSEKMKQQEGEILICDLKIV